MNAANPGTTPVDMDVTGQDFYIGGPGDLVQGLTVTPLGERWLGVPGDVAGGGTGNLEMYDFGAFRATGPSSG